MNSEPIGSLSRTDNRFEFRYPDLGLKIQGPYIEWVLEAAAEIIHKLERLRAEGTIEELEMTREFGDADAASIEIDKQKYEMSNRFDVIPQCLVSLGPSDYRWVSSSFREVKSPRIGDRLHDMSLTRSDSFTDRNGQTEPHFSYVKT